MERLTKRYNDGGAYSDCSNGIQDVGSYKAIYEGTIIDKLADYEDLEEQGLLVKLPCKIGGTIYAIIDRKIYNLELKDFRRNRYCKNGNDNELDLYCVNVLDKNDYRWLYSGDYSKVFKTREQAEQALEEMEG